MNEKLLQYIWQFQYFNNTDLLSAQNLPIHILHPGTLNTNQGPDFANARIKIGDTVWAGSVELHLNASDWLKHKHQNDPAYDKIILHVVLKNDADITTTTGIDIPTLALENRISHSMLQQYSTWMQVKTPVACLGQWQQVAPLTLTHWKERMLVSRLQEKTDHIQFLLAQNNGHWEEVCWQMVARYYGGSTNAESFEQIARSLPIKILARHKAQIHQLECLLLGQAGLLHKGLTDQYAVMLFKEYQFLQKKYNLQVVNKPPIFLRLRPSNFPTIRLAQLAMLVHKRSHIFAAIIDNAEPPAYLFNVEANDYWSYHYKMDDASDFTPKQFGKTMTNIVLINAVVPMVYAYGKATAQPNLTEKAMQWLEKISPEKNSLIKPWLTDGFINSNAFDSQALIQLTKQYCHPRLCLSCAIAHAILKRQ